PRSGDATAASANGGGSRSGATSRGTGWTGILPWAVKATSSKARGIVIALMNVPVSRILGAIVLVAMGTLLPMGAASAEGTGAPGAAEKPRPPAPAPPPHPPPPPPRPRRGGPAGDGNPPAESPEPPTEVKKEIERSK